MRASALISVTYNVRIDKGAGGNTQGGGVRGLSINNQVVHACVEHIECTAPRAPIIAN